MVHAPLRMMVAGDRSSVGKSTISLGLLVALLDAGFLPHEVAYIKPATQCVSSTLVARFCEEQGIACEHIGPVVYYRGFTRQQLDNPSEHNALVAQCSEAVDRISTGKRITVIDGVGYPSVGSVVGCSSADLAVACAAPVLLVGKPGVGDAVDSFNLCARYFEAQAVPVLGSIFNRLSPSGFYSLDTCRRYLRKYMAGSRPRQRVYGMLPVHETLGTLGAEEACGLSFERPKARPAPPSAAQRRPAPPSAAQRRPAPPSAAQRRPAPPTADPLQTHACLRAACLRRARMAVARCAGASERRPDERGGPRGGGGTVGTLPRARRRQAAASRPGGGDGAPIGVGGGPSAVPNRRGRVGGRGKAGNRTRTSSSSIGDD
jgi:dethiobiotin synthetase